MNSIKLPNRLLCVANCVESCRLLADIGTDHAYIPMYLVEKGIANNAIASDVVKGPVNIARENIKARNLQDKIKVVMADGLAGAVGADTAVIAGMGGTLICKILEDNSQIAHSIDRLVLQPMTCNYELRKYLHQNGYEIISEHLAQEERKIYNIMVVRSGSQHYEDEFHYYIGKCLFDQNDTLLPKYLKHKATVLKRRIDGMSNSQSLDTSKECEVLRPLYERYVKEIKKYDHSK